LLQKLEVDMIAAQLILEVLNVYRKTQLQRGVGARQSVPRKPPTFPIREMWAIPQGKALTLAKHGLGRPSR
jgi:hypothetical protein